MSQTNNYSSKQSDLCAGWCFPWMSKRLQSASGIYFNKVFMGVQHSIRLDTQKSFKTLCVCILASVTSFCCFSHCLLEMSSPKSVLVSQGKTIITFVTYSGFAKCVCLHLTRMLFPSKDGSFRTLKRHQRNDLLVEGDDRLPGVDVDVAVEGVSVFEH